MRYRGVMFKSSDGTEVLFCIPTQDANGDYAMTPPRTISGWDVEMSTNEIIVGEFILFDGTSPIELQDYMDRMDEEVNADNDCSLYIRAVKVAVQDCGSCVHDMFVEDREQFAYACFQKVAQAKSQGLFDQRRILPQWKKAGYDRSVIGEVVDYSFS